jgi:[ribosomal protein S5]-alanine N-acetyltransferase
MEEITLETNRLILKSINPKNVHDLFNSFDKETIMNKLGIDEAVFVDYEQMHLKGMETFQISFCYFIISRKDNNSLIGECGFHSWNKKHKRAELFYKLNNDANKRNGFISEALRVVLEFGFKQMDLNRIEAFISDNNEPSKRLLIKNDFIKEGTLKSHYYFNGNFEDSDCYALLRQNENYRRMKE